MRRGVANRTPPLPLLLLLLLFVNAMGLIEGVSAGYLNRRRKRRNALTRARDRSHCAATNDARCERENNNRTQT
jgi:hypothetical protein